MTRLRCNGIELECLVTGNVRKPLVVLISGMGAQLTMWPATFIQIIADAGYRVAAFDNRDVGLSTWFDAVASGADIRRALQGEGQMPESYDLQDMAADTRALVTALGADDAHVIGMSMGGVIGQLMLIHHPEVVRSFVQIASTTGEPELPGPDPEIGAFLAMPPLASDDRAGAIERAVAFTRLLAAGSAASDDAVLARLASADYDRANHPDGGLRQLLAVMATPPRGRDLARIRVPTLVVHGEQDRMVPLECGRATAEWIPGARLQVIPDMGHLVEERLAAPLAQVIVDFLGIVDGRAGQDGR